ncbi:MAG: hypothetical protein ACI4E1_11805 [Lachnospira sp.]
MIITEEILRNLELKKGILRTERCDEIDAMKIKNPYYPSGNYVPGEYYKAERNDSYIYALDGRIAYTWGRVFGPLPITFRECIDTYDDIYLLFIDNEYFELIFEFDSQEHYNDEDNNKEVYRYRYILKENKSLSNRPDKNEIIHLIGKLKCCSQNLRRYRLFGTYFEADIVYEGEEYKWMD